MAQFQVYRLKSGELVVDCQTDELCILPSRFVVPILDPKLVPNPVRALHPIFDVDGRELVFAAHLGAAISRSELSGPLLSLDAERYTILNALDFLITGV